MYEIIQSATFSKWLRGLKDQQARMRVHVRLDRVSLGNFGDAEPIGEGLSELRIHYGPGYRLYYLQRDMRVVMLCGGDKSSQHRDIEKAKTTGMNPQASLENSFRSTRWEIIPSAARDCSTYQFRYASLSELEFQQ